jgi:hypothetical protein
VLTFFTHDMVGINFADPSISVPIAIKRQFKRPALCLLFSFMMWSALASLIPVYSVPIAIGKQFKRPACLHFSLMIWLGLASLIPVYSVPIAIGMQFKRRTTCFFFHRKKILEQAQDFLPIKKGPFGALLISTVIPLGFEPRTTTLKV